MKSRISIDVDYDNQPIIKIEYQESDDVRDKLVKRFMEAFGGKSTFANFWYIDSIDTINSKAKLRPISSEDAEKINEVFYASVGPQPNITIE
jgi:hypothetical protein